LSDYGGSTHSSTSSQGPGAIPPPAGPPYGPSTGGSPYGQPGGPGAPAAKGFFSALFDFSFSSFITPMIVKAVYVLALVALGLAWLLFLVVAFSRNPVGGLFVLVIGPVIVLIYLAFIRMTLEFYLAIVRMSQDIHHRQVL
jgi:hypothetical protein